MPTNNFVESSFWNFDALFQPQQHPARDAHDTFFLSGIPHAENALLILIEHVVIWFAVPSPHQATDVWLEYTSQFGINVMKITLGKKLKKLNMSVKDILNFEGKET